MYLFLAFVQWIGQHSSKVRIGVRFLYAGPIIHRRMNNKSNWVSRDLRTNESWVYELGKNDIDEIHNAIKKTKDLPFKNINRYNFKLPFLSIKINQMKEHLIHGNGVVLIRNFPVDCYNDLDAIRGYVGLIQHVGNLRMQPGNVMTTRVTDMQTLSMAPTKYGKRHGFNNDYQDPHTDNCDLVSLLCYNTSFSGGGTFFASSKTIVDNMSDKEREYLTFFFPHNRRGAILKNENPWYFLPVLQQYQDNTIVSFNSKLIHSAIDTYDMCPRVPDPYLNALEKFKTLAKDPEICYKTFFNPGDIQILNNLKCVHGRESYVDRELKVRHLMRLWISPVEAIPVPQCYSTHWESLEPGSRGGSRGYLSQQHKMDTLLFPSLDTQFLNFDYVKNTNTIII